MKNLSATAERLRAIRKAQEHFLALYALECIWEQSGPYDRLAKDLAAFDGGPDEGDSALSRRMGDR